MFRRIFFLAATLGLALALWKGARPDPHAGRPGPSSWELPGLSKRYRALPYCPAKRAPKSLTDLKKEVTKRPQDPVALMNLGTALSQRFHSPGEAIGYLERALMKAPQNGSAYFELVGAYLNAALVERGCEYFSKLAGGGFGGLPEEALADLKASSGQPEAALAHIKSALKANPRSSSALSLLASIYLQLGQVSQAEQVLASMNSAETSEGG